MIGAKIGIFQEKDKNDPAELLRTQSGVPRIRKTAALPSTLPVLGLWEVPGKGPARTERQFEPQGRAQGTPQGLPATRPQEQRVVCPGQPVFKDSYIEASAFQDSFFGVF